MTHGRLDELDAHHLPLADTHDQPVGHGNGIGDLSLASPMVPPPTWMDRRASL
jgi:hypothetical protein